jgi:FMN phosphatase YigB (HAD superfamily)
MASFERSLIDCFTKLSQAPPTVEQCRCIAGFARSIAEQAIELLPGVADTLPLLAKRHRLILVTKGNAREQQKKLDRSGIHMHFTAVEIPPEKHPDAYREIVSRYALAHETTWMIGNSPRSDINPALAAGLHAVYMHHPNTWVLEHDDLAQPMPPATAPPARSIRGPRRTSLVHLLRDLSLATAYALGHEVAWERFIAVLRAHSRWPPSPCGDRSSPNACCNRNWAQ